MKNKLIALLTLLNICYLSINAQNGSTGCNADSSCYDSDYPEIKEWAKAGRRGGIPTISNIKATLNPGGNIQNAIDRGGAGVVLLNNGTYTVNRSINLKDGVILRGRNKNGVKLSVKMKSGRAIVFGRGVNNAGLEDMRVVYEALPNPPKEYRTGFQDGRFCRECFENVFPSNNNTLVRLDGDDNWVDDVDFINSGSDPVEIFGKHNTFRNSLVDNCYNKGEGGEGYFDIRGDYNLVIGSTVRKIRHFAIQNGARYNVVFKNNLEVDVNFHNGDDGRNLIEQNSIIRPSWHTWGVFATGGARYGHDKPGPRNIIVNNTTFDYRENKKEFSDRNVVYTYRDYGEPDRTNWSMPSCGTFYAVKCGSGGGGNNTVPVTGVSISDNSITLTVNQTRDLDATVSPKGATNKSVNWSSNNTAVARVNSNGLVTAVSNGSAIITVTTVDGNKKATSRITVKDTDGNGGDSTIKNLALKKPTKSENSQNGNPASNAVDGNTNTRWSSNGFSKWLEVDLQSLKNISRTELVCYQNRAYQFTIQVKEKVSDAYRTVVDRSNNKTKGTVDKPIKDSFNPINARYIRINVTGADSYTGSWVSLLEFRVFGKDADTSTGGGESVTTTLSPIQDAYLENATRKNVDLIRVENNRRVGYLLFDVSQIKGAITSARLELTCTSDAGNGTIEIQQGNKIGWTENTLSNTNKPSAMTTLGSLNQSFKVNSTYKWNLKSLKINNQDKLALILEHKGGNDVGFASKENKSAIAKPKLVITYQSGRDNDLTDTRKTSIFPNPFTDQFNLRLIPNRVYYSVKIVNINGQIIYDKAITDKADTLQINLEHIESGIYFVQLTGEKGMESLKIMKN
ncbi:discoidin domain-containing protein [Aquimarina sp. RZ0]|uniref:discoidin domain-containing protein n=1 Tax=Aquimarina sp. RZ0 TaxID=2607730 RepID=UPI0011F3F9F7|nr:discoidin domain-containing protein [Aquimarina sp. RZ0]KAA1246306.1 T9SS type A sorting domain-containing protein [Aquimarina sp. RZ0]